MKNTNLLLQIDSISKRLSYYKEILEPVLYEEILHAFYLLEAVYFGVQDIYSALYNINTLDPAEKKALIKVARRISSRLLNSMEDGEVYHFSTKVDRNENLENYRKIMKTIDRMKF